MRDTHDIISRGTLRDVRDAHVRDARTLRVRLRPQKLPLQIHRQAAPALPPPFPRRRSGVQRMLAPAGERVRGRASLVAVAVAIVSSGGDVRWGVGEGAQRPGRGLQDEAADAGEEVEEGLFVDRRGVLVSAPIIPIYNTRTQSPCALESRRCTGSSDALSFSCAPYSSRRDRRRWRLRTLASRSPAFSRGASKPLSVCAEG